MPRKASITVSPTKFIIVAVIILTTGLLIGRSLHSKNYQPEGQIIAHIGDTPIYLEEAEIQLKILARGQKTPSFSTLNKEAKQAIVKEVIARKRIFEQAKDSHLDEDPEIKKQIHQFTEQLLTSRYLDNLAKEQITEENLLQKYEELATDLKGRTEYRVSHILLNDEKDAKSVYGKRYQASFEKLAQKHSTDKQSAQKGGDLGYLISGRMNSEFEKHLSKLKIGTLSKPFKTNLGWHIIKLVEKHPAEAAPFEKVRHKLEQSKQKEIIQDYTKSLLEGEEIEWEEGQDTVATDS